MNTENRTRIVILTGFYRIMGYIDVLPGARVTDFLTECKQFVAVTEAEVWDLEGRRLFASDFMNVNRDAVEVIMPVSTVSHGLGVAG